MRTRTGKVPRRGARGPSSSRCSCRPGPTPAAGCPASRRSSAPATPIPRDGAPSAVSSSLAHPGIATIAIDRRFRARGGSIGSYTVTRSRSQAPGQLVSFSGRGLDRRAQRMKIDSTPKASMQRLPQFLVGDFADSLPQDRVRPSPAGGGAGPGRRCRRRRRERPRTKTDTMPGNRSGIYGGAAPGSRAEDSAPACRMSRAARSSRSRSSRRVPAACWGPPISRVPSLYNATPNPTFTSFVEEQTAGPAPSSTPCRAHSRSSSS